MVKWHSDIILMVTGCEQKARWAEGWMYLSAKGEWNVRPRFSSELMH